MSFFTSLPLFLFQMDIRGSIYNLTSSIVPIDPLEQEHKDLALQWIKSGAELFRLQKPDIPKTHLVSYFLALNTLHDKVLLGHHKIADLWLPSGGHIDKGEHPQETVKRECLEELKVNAHFLQEDPLFLTVTDVHVNNQKHTDVSFWFVIQADDQTQIDFCRDEYYRMECPNPDLRVEM